jgi:hypothetical protein
MSWKDILEAGANGNTWWEEKLVDFATFVEDANYSGHPALSDAQYYEAYRLLGKSPEQVFSFEYPVREAVWLIGKGGGKGVVSTLIENYCMYLLLNCRDPHKYFGIASADPLEFINVATVGGQSADLFRRMQLRLIGNRWFRDRYEFVEEHKITNKLNNSKGLIKFTGANVDLPKNLRAQCVNAKNEHWEGKSICLWLCDEVSGFTSENGQNNAKRIVNTLRTSTREIPYKGLMTSYPRLDEDSDFCYLEMKKAISEKVDYMVGCTYFTWQFKPGRLYKRGFFYFDINANKQVTLEDKDKDGVFEIPMEEKPHFDSDPDDAKAKYMCILGSIEDRYVEDISWINNIRLRGEPIVKVAEANAFEDGKLYLRKKIMSTSFSPGINYVVAIDGGEKICDTSVAMGHREGDDVVVDALIIYEPDFGKDSVYVSKYTNLDIRADLLNITEDFLPELKNSGAKISLVMMDHWNAASMESSLFRRGLKSDRNNVSRKDYDLWRGVVSSGLLVLPEQPESYKAIKQMKALGRPGAGKPLVKYGKQDIIDSVVQIARTLYSEEEFVKKRAAPGVGAVVSKEIRSMEDVRVADVERALGLRQVTPRLKRPGIGGVVGGRR